MASPTPPQWRVELDPAIWEDWRMVKASWSELGRLRLTSTRYVHVFVAFGCMWTRWKYALMKPSVGIGRQMWRVGPNLAPGGPL